MVNEGLRGLLLCALLPAMASAAAEEFDGFTEPFRVLDLASTDVSTVAEIFVVKGDVVAAGDPLVRLDTRVLQGALASADRRRAASGRVRSAEALVRLRRSHVDKLRPLLASGHAQATELAKAQAELDIAEADLLGAREDREIADFDYRRLALEIERRTITSPVAATVLTIHKELGEAVIPADPTLVTIAQLDPLKISLQVPTAAIDRFTIDAEIAARCGKPARTLPARVSYIAPVTNAESGTVLVELLIANTDSAYRAGLHCTLAN